MYTHMHMCIHSCFHAHTQALTYLHSALHKCTHINTLTRTAYMHTCIYVHLYFYLLENANTKGIIIDCFLIGIARCTVDGSIVGAHVQDWF